MWVSVTMVPATARQVTLVWIALAGLVPMIALATGIVFVRIVCVRWVGLGLTVR